MDAAASGAQGCRRADLSVSEQRRADERRFNVFQNFCGRTWPVGGLVEVAAYGEVVWSWHPLLVSSRRRRDRPTGLDRLNSPAMVTK